MARPVVGRPLNSALDATRFSAYLSRAGFDVKTLVDAHATRANIVDSMASRGAEHWFFYSGRGTPEGIMAFDTDSDRPSTLVRLSDLMVSAARKSSDSSSIIGFVFDNCSFSAREISMAKAVAQSLLPKTEIVALFAAAPGQAAFEGESGGVFANAFVQTVESKEVAKRQRLTVEDLLDGINRSKGMIDHKQRATVFALINERFPAVPLPRSIER